jgi:hypothetical protein
VYGAQVSYDLAVWEGDRPADDAATGNEFARLYKSYLNGSGVPPTPRVAAYVQALLDRYPDIGTRKGRHSPWSTAPLIGEAAGPVVYVPMVYSRCEEVSAWAAQLAHEHGLVCYDPQLEQLRPDDGRPWRFELRASGGRMRDPDPETVRKALVKLGPDNFHALLERADGWYVQAAYGTRAGTRPGCYALERQDGDLSHHYRTELTDIQEVIRGFLAFLDDDPTLNRRFAWRHYPL